MLEEIQQWAAEYEQIGGAKVPEGFLKFIANRLGETLPAYKDWITIYKDGRKKRIRITGQVGNLVRYEDDGGNYGVCTVDQMKVWAKSTDVVKAVDYAKFGEAQALADQLGGWNGSDKLDPNSIGD